MKSIDTYNITSEEWVTYKSKICSVACSLEYQEWSDLEKRIEELSQSYLNQWQFVISAYKKLFDLFSELDTKSNKSENLITEYDLYSIEKEKEFRDYTYLLIISMKTFLDLFACLVDITVTQTIKGEGELPSFHGFARANNFSNVAIAHEFQNFRDKEQYPWIYLLNECRNRIVHRGYNIKPEFHFKKGRELTMIIYKGIGNGLDNLRLEIGNLFDQFMLGMSKIDDRISSILISAIEKLENKLRVEVSYKFGDEITEFSFCEIT